MGLFEYLKEILSCNYISDMHYGKYNMYAREIMRSIDFCDYSLAELSDAAEYLYGCNIKFGSVCEAERFFRSEH